MRILMSCVVAASLFVSVAQAADPKTEEQKALYALGLAIAQNLGSFSLTAAELEMVKTGLSDGVLKKKPKVELQAYGPKIGELQQARVGKAAEKEKKAGKAFADKAAAEKGSVKTDSGLVITTIKEGKGASPKATDKVKVHYEGKLTDGTVFDSSVQRGEPVEFALNGVLPCWTEGVQKLKVGGKARLVCPSDIGYGDQGRPPRIPPGATLVFEVELLEIAKADAEAKQ
jgi:FKBP-type peptidyl-prolyl cis-trans isomerase FkpA